MLILQRIVQNIWSTKIKGPLVRTFEPLIGTHSPIPDLALAFSRETGGGLDQLT